MKSNNVSIIILAICSILLAILLQLNLQKKADFELRIEVLEASLSNTEIALHHQKNLQFANWYQAVHGFKTHISVKNLENQKRAFDEIIKGKLFIALPSIVIREKMILRSPSKVALFYFILSILIYIVLDTLLYVLIPELSEAYIAELNKLNNTQETSLLSIPQSLINLIFTIGMSTFGLIIVRQKKILKNA